MATLYKTITLLFFCLLPFGSHAEPGVPSAADDTQTPEYICWTGAATPGRLLYELAVVREALQRSEEIYGPYQLELNDSHLSPVRGRSELAAGEKFHFVATTFAAHESTLDVIVVTEPIAFGLLGNRQLIVREQDLETFIDIDAQQLAGLAAGQGRGWPEINIYQTNNFKVEALSEFSHLFPNLLAGRVDYIPLGIEEVGPTLAAYAEQYPGLAVVPGLLIRYPLPVYFVVTDKQPKLAERLQWGLAKLREEGRLLELFRQYKSHALATLQDPDNKVIELHNPTLFSSEK